MEFESDKSPFDRQNAARHVGRAVRTLLITPLHPRVYRVIKDEDSKAGVTVPLQPEVEQVTNGMQTEILPWVRTFGETMSGSDTAITAGLLMQFSNHLNELPPHLNVPYETVRSLGSACIERAEERGRLSMVDQLSVALDQADGNLSEGLRRIFITSRMYARWLDRRAVLGTPEFSTSERLQQMRAWQDSLLGFKPGANEYHDTAGDTYYAWTHAYAGYMFDRLQLRPTLSARLARTAFRNGTRIMQTCVNNLNPRGTISDHTVAAHYGNAVADVLAGRED